MISIHSVRITYAFVIELVMLTALRTVITHTRSRMHICHRPLNDKRQLAPALSSVTWQTRNRKKSQEQRGHQLAINFIISIVHTMLSIINASLTKFVTRPQPLRQSFQLLHVSAINPAARKGTRMKAQKKKIKAQIEEKKWAPKDKKKRWVLESQLAVAILNTFPFQSHLRRQAHKVGR